MAYLFDTVQYLSFGTIKDSFFWYFIPSGVSPRPFGVDRLSAEGVVLYDGRNVRHYVAALEPYDGQSAPQQHGGNLLIKPEFSLPATTAYSFTIDENRDGSLSAISLGSVVATYSGEGGIDYSLETLAGTVPSDFAIDATSGLISYTGDGFDYEARLGDDGELPDITLVARATVDSGVTQIHVVKIIVANVSEAPILARIEGRNAFYLEVDDAPNDFLSTVKLTASDPDNTARFEASDFTITVNGTASTLFEVVATDDGAYNVSLKAGEDLALGHYRLSITVNEDASEGGLASAPLVIDVYVGPVVVAETLDMSATISANIRADSTIPTLVFSVSDADADTLYEAADFIIQDANVTSELFEVNAVDSDSFTIALKPNASLSAGVHNLSILLKDDAGEIIDTPALNYTVTVIETPLRFVPKSTSSVKERGEVFTYTAQASSALVTDSFTYQIKETGDHAAFKIDTNSGQVTFAVGHVPDYAKQSSYAITIIATSTHSTNSAEQAFTLKLSEVPDDEPVFLTADTTAFINEGEAFQKSFKARYNPENEAVVYRLSGIDEGLFDVNSKTGLVTSKAAPHFVADYEVKSSYHFTVTASSKSPNSGFFITERDFVVQILDSNEAPTFLNDIKPVEFDEYQTPVIAINAQGNFKNHPVKFSLSGQDADLFTIDEATNELRVKDGITFRYLGEIERPTEGAAELDPRQDENSPHIIFATDTPTTFNIKENSYFEIPLIAATSTIGDVRYSLEGEDAAYFLIEPEHGRLVARPLHVFDYETKTAYEFYVIAKAGGQETSHKMRVNVENEFDTPPVLKVTITASTGEGDELRSSQRDFELVVKDVTDIAPVFTGTATTGTVIEGTAFTHMFNARATSAIRYELSGPDHALFEIFQNGQVTSKTGTKFEFLSDKTSYQFTVKATSELGSATKDFVLTVTNAFVHGDDEGAVDENTAFSKSFALVNDIDGTFRYFLSGDHGHLFRIDNDTGLVRSKDNTNFDAEGFATSYDFTVIASSIGGDKIQRFERDFTLTVRDVLDTVPEFQLPSAPFAVFEGLDFEQKYTALSNSQDVRITYSLEGADANLFTINAVTGILKSKADTGFTYGDGTNEIALTIIAKASLNDVEMTSQIALKARVRKPAETDLVVEEGPHFSKLFAVESIESTKDFTYRLTGEDAHLFDLDPKTGLLKQKSSLVLDAETEKLDQVDFPPLPSSPILSFDNDVPLNSTNSSPVTFRATSDVAGIITYHIEGRDADDFTINSETGELSIIDASSRSYTAQPSHRVEIIATHVAESDGTVSQQGRVYIFNLVNLGRSVDFADNNPRTVRVTENEALSPFTISASSREGAIEYRLDGADADAFEINSSTGRITAKAETKFDYETQSSYEIQIIASVPSRSNVQEQITTVHVHVDNVIEEIVGAPDPYVASPLPSTALVNFASDTPTDVTMAENADFAPVTFALTAASMTPTRYVLTGRDAAFFQLADPSSPILTAAANAVFDYEYQQSYDVNLVAEYIASSGVVHRQGTAFTVNLSDVEETLAFDNDYDEFIKVSEGTGDEFSMGLRARGQANPLYSLAGVDASYFTIDANTGHLTLAEGGAFDYDVKPYYEVIIVGRANGETATKKLVVGVIKTQTYDLSIIASNKDEVHAERLSIKLLDSNDNAPKFANDITSVQVFDDDEFSHSFAVDADVPGSQINYYLAGADAALFEISDAGILRLKPYQKLDSDGFSRDYKVTVTAIVGIEDKAQSLSRDFTITAFEGDVIEPHFNHGITSYTIDENSSYEDFSLFFTAIPDASDQNITYGLSTANYLSFEINDHGLLTIKPWVQLNAEVRSQYKVKITATADGDSFYSVSRDFTLFVKDLTDNPPVFTGRASTAQISEVAAFAIDMSATPDVPNTPLNYHLTGTDGALFTIDDDGIITKKLSTTFELDGPNPKSTYNVTVHATDNSGDKPYDASHNLTITVVDGNDIIPTFEALKLFDQVTEGGSYSGNYRASPDVLNDTVFYDIEGADKAFFTIDNDGQVTSNTGVVFDADGGKTSYKFDVIAETRSDNVPQTNRQSITITVLDINDEDPVFVDTSTAGTLDEGRGFSLSFKALPDVSTDKISYDLTGADEESFEISDDGLVTSKASTVFEADGTGAKLSYDFTVTATAESGDVTKSASRNYALTINDVDDLFYKDYIINRGTNLITISSEEFDPLPDFEGAIDYKIVELPSHFTFKLGDKTLAIGDEFTKADVDGKAFSITIDSLYNEADGAILASMDRIGEIGSEFIYLQVDVREAFAIANNKLKDDVDASLIDEALIISTGDGRDKITDGSSDDYIETGLGRDVVTLSGGGADTIFYRIEPDASLNNGNGGIIATDGRDTIKEFTLGEDALVFRIADTALSATNSTNSVLSYLVLQGVEARIMTGFVGNERHATGIQFLFSASGKTASGSSAGRDLRIEFETSTLYTDFVTTLDSTVDGAYRQIADLTKLENIFGDNIAIQQSIISGTAGDDVIYGTDLTDVINPNGADTITLATGSQTMIYLIESDSENKKVTLFDGADVINAYEHMTDRLLFVDANERGLGARAELADATGLDVTFLTDGSDYTGFTLTDEDGVMLTVNLATNIQGSDAAALQAAIADTAQSDLSVLLQYFLPENQFDITIDTSPGSIPLL